MLSTMPDFPLTIRHIFEHGRDTYPDSQIITLTADGERRIDFASLAKRVGKLANALHRAGVREGDRVGTFAWNNQEHQEAYMAVPCSGAVLHTINIRLDPEQIAYIINHAEDKILLLDANLAGHIAPALKKAETLEKVVVDTVEAGYMTKDLALLVGDQQGWLTTEGFLDKVAENLKAALPDVG